MKAGVILLLTMFLFSHVNAQEDSVSTTNQQKYLKYYELDEEQWDSWNTIDSIWTKDYFKNCLSENGLRLNCEDCENAYLSINIDIDSLGIITNYSVVKSNICGSEISSDLEKSFMHYFLTIHFPVLLRNIKIQVTIGDGLKC